MNECQQVECNNAGRLVKCVITVDGKDEVHEIYLCRNHITEVNLQRGISN